jgi:hypothetical protein
MSLIRSSKVAFVVGILFLAVMTGCSSVPVSPVPERLDALYVATHVQGQPLPATQKGVDSEMTLLADTLRFSADGTVRRTTVLRTVDPSWTPPGGVVNVLNIEMHYYIDGKQLLVGASCFGTESCGPFNGRINEDHVFLPANPLRYPSGNIVYSRVITIIELG